MNNVEIERKFLVRDSSYRQMAQSQFRIVQGYLCQDPDRTVRVRIKGEKGYLTIKSRPDEKGWSRYELEKQITPAEAEELLQLCLPSVIDKVRYNVPFGNILVEVDEFSGDNAGLVVAEIELESESQSFDVPDFIGQEVTGDVRYYNVQLAQNPYKEWKKNDDQLFNR